LISINASLREPALACFCERPAGGAQLVIHSALRPCRRCLVARSDRLYDSGGNEPVCTMYAVQQMARSGWLVPREGNTGAHQRDGGRWTRSRARKHGRAPGVALQADQPTDRRSRLLTWLG
jgi:hypothetical protein